MSHDPLRVFLSRTSAMVMAVELSTNPCLTAFAEIASMRRALLLVVSWLIDRNACPLLETVDDSVDIGT